MADIGRQFAARGIIFISFAKLANRVKKTEDLKRRLGIKSKGHVPAVVIGGGGGGRASSSQAKSKQKASKASKSKASKASKASKSKKKEIVEETDEDESDIVEETDEGESDIEEEEEEEEEAPPPKSRKSKSKSAKQVYDVPKKASKASKASKSKSKKKEIVEETDEDEEEAPPPPPPPKSRKSKSKSAEQVYDEPQKSSTSKTSKSSNDTSSGTPLDFIASRLTQWYNISDVGRIKKELRDIGITKIEDFVDLDNTVLIIDEVHNLFRPLANQKKEHNYVEAHIVNPVMHPGLKVVVLTATPGDNVNDVMKLLNIVRDPTNAVIRPPNPESAEDVMRFKNDIRGLISYFEMSNDVTKFPKVLDNGPIKYPMSTTQFAKYFEAYNAVTADAKNYDKLAKENQLNKFWAGARRYSNMLFKLEKGLSLTEFSSKLPALLKNIEDYPEQKHYVYSAFFSNMGSSHGILEIARQLEAKGYTKLTVKDAKEANKAGKTLPPGKRYMLALPSEIASTSTSAAASASAGKNLHEMISIFNSTANARGQLVEVFLATKGFNEGLDLKAVRHIHIFEPLVTMASDLQTIGRARRYCSHADLDHKDWTVQIHRYLSDFPVNVKTTGTNGIKDRLVQLTADVADLAAKVKETKDADQKKAIKQQIAEHKADLKKLNDDVKRADKMDVSKVKNIDEFIYQEAQSRMRELFVVYHSMKEAAMDCFLLKNFHADDTIQCLV
jgi:hypothetical protein